MPHGENWFSYLLSGSPIWENLRNLIAAINMAMFGRDTSALSEGDANPMATVTALFVSLVVVAMAIVANGAIKDPKTAIVPEDRLSVRTFMELFVGTVLSMMSDIMGPKAARHFLPLIGTSALFIFVSNGLGMVPGFTPATDNVSVTLALALVVFVATHVYGLRANGWAHVKHLFGPVTFDPKKPITVFAIPLMLLMFAIEVISHVARPISLSVRLAANMTADHLVVGAFATIFAFVVPVPVMVLGALVVVVQTLVFCILSTVYIGMAIEHHDHGDDHHEAAHQH